MTGPLARLLRPRSIAVVGGREAERALEQCERFGFEGPIWPVNPNRESMRGRPCASRLQDLDEAPDAAFVAVPRETTVSCVKALADMGAGGAVCYASGFLESEAETAGGRELQERLVAAAGEMPLVGPNCYGMLNAATGAALWPDQHGLARCERGVAVLLQSSNLAINLSMQRRGLPVAFLGTVGNQACTGMSALAEGLLHDPAVTALGLHIEGIDSVRGFERMAALARETGKPVVALPVGQSELSRAAARTHTAAITGGPAVTEAFLRRLGIATVQSLPALTETMQLLHAGGPLSGGDLCSLSCSGGEAALVADAARGRAVAFRPLSAEGRASVKATLPALVTVANPLDYHTFHWANEEALYGTFRAMVEERYDLALLILDDPHPDRCDGAEWAIARKAWVRAVRDAGCRAAVVATLPENINPDGREELAEAGIPALAGIGEAIAAAEAAARIGTAWSGPPPAPALHSPPLLLPPVTLDEAKSKALLADAGIAVPRGRLAESADDAVAIARDLGCPVAIKRLGVDHKSDAGAVLLDIAGDEAVADGALTLLVEGAPLLVEEMVAGGVVELHLGLLRDPACGMALILGAGGTLVELADDAGVLPLPATADNVRDTLLGLRAGRILEGWRGGPKGDLEATVQTALALGLLAESCAGRIEEADINPLIVRREGQGAVAADALIRMRPEQESQGEDGGKNV